MKEFSQDSKIYYFYGKHKLIPKPDKKGSKDVSGYYYRCYEKDKKDPLFFSHNYRSGYAANLFWKNQDTPDYYLKLRKSFPLTGKIDLYEKKTDLLKGIVTRSRKIYDSQENLAGRFIDTRTWKDHLGESVVDAVGNLIFNGDDNPAHSDGSNSFILIKDKLSMGTLTKIELPFFPDPPARTEPHSSSKIFKKFLPKKLGKAIFDITPPVGWKLELIEASIYKDPFLILCGALMTIDIRRW